MEHQCRIDMDDNAKLSANQERMQDPAQHTVLEAAAVVLRDLGKAHYREIAREIETRGLTPLAGKTPEATVNSRLSSDIKRRGNDSQFVRLVPGVYALREQPGTKSSEDFVSPGNGGAQDYDQAMSTTEEDRRVRVPLFPVYDEVRHLLRVWPRWTRTQVTGFHSTLSGLRGTPQNTVDWQDPDSWIPERLGGDDRNLAEAIWTKSGRSVNPRYTTGHWLLCQKYALLMEVSGKLALTERGQSFLDHENGEAEAFIDEQEGLLEALRLVTENGPTRFSGVLGEWGEYLARHSRFGTDSTRKDTLRRRLSNLVQRALVSRKGTLYTATESGRAYIKRLGIGETRGNRRHRNLLLQVRQQSEVVREQLRERLLAMDPFVFEHLVKRLLEEMDYQDVKVTKQSGDGGVDVVAEIEIGITSVTEVVQAKRHRRTVQRKDLDALRGSLYRYRAVRGTIITTSRFSAGTKAAAVEPGAAPITLVDGNKLLDLLIKHEIGIRKQPIEVIEVDPQAFEELLQVADE